jgi:hypothetical protein
VTTDEIITLLQAIGVYTGKEVDEAAVAAWSESARRRSWTFPEAIDAVHEHFADETGWIMPGHVTQLIRRVRGANWQD